MTGLSMRCGVSTGQMVVGDSGPADYQDLQVQAQAHGALGQKGRIALQDFVGQGIGQRDQHTRQHDEKRNDAYPGRDLQHVSSSRRLAPWAGRR